MSNGNALQFAAEECKRDRAFVLATVEQDGLLLEFVPEEFKQDREIVLAAISSCDPPEPYYDSPLAYAAD
eukprot:3107217-Amphidinium_carterae.1